MKCKRRKYKNVAFNSKQLSRISKMSRIMAIFMYTYVNEWELFRYLYNYSRVHNTKMFKIFYPYFFDDINFKSY